ncbi:MAG TPA: hypothetical protein VIC00_00490, partial [Candidatus Acidoferrales bacterium]
MRKKSGKKIKRRAFVAPATAAAAAGAASAQRCIQPGCEAEFGLRERIFVCARCGGPLEIKSREVTPAVARTLRELWLSRRSSLDPRDRSGVWRFRELLPFDPSDPVVTLFEGNTPLYDAPRSAKYAGLDALRLKHQGC